MTQLFYPFVNFLVGLALAVYGLIHSATHVPGSDQLHVFYAALPSVGAVMIFFLGVIAVAGGLSMLANGVHGLRKRRRQLNRIYRTAPEPYDEDDQDYYR